MEKEKVFSGKSLGSSAVALGVGGASFYAATKAAQSISFLQSKWYATPLALGIVGHLAKSFSSTGGTAAVGAAGALFAFSYYVNKQSTTTTTTTTTGTTGTAPAQGLTDRAGDAGMLRTGTGEAGALVRGNPTSYTAMRQFRGGYAGRGSPSAYRQPSMAGMLVS
jgi:hypothetical protein